MNTPTQSDQNITLPEPASSQPVAPQPSAEATAPVQEIPHHAAAVPSADDSDVIDGAWLSRVEQVFHAHADDPRALAAQFSELKTEYVVQRYGKSVKKADE